MTIGKIAKPERWPTIDEMDDLMKRIKSLHDAQYTYEEPADPLDIACRALLWAWECGCVRIQNPEGAAL